MMMSKSKAVSPVSQHPAGGPYVFQASSLLGGRRSLGCLFLLRSGLSLLLVFALSVIALCHNAYLPLMNTLRHVDSLASFVGMQPETASILAPCWAPPPLLPALAAPLAGLTLGQEGDEKTRVTQEGPWLARRGPIASQTAQKSSGQEIAPWRGA